MIKRFMQMLFGRILLSFVAIIIVVHISMFLIFLKQNQANNTTIKRNEAIQKIVNAVFLVEATPESSRAQAVQAFADPEMEVSLTQQPLWDEQFETMSYWAINHALYKEHNNYAISLKLGPHDWLNVKAVVYYHYFMRQLIFFSIELFVFACVFISLWSVYRFTEPLRRFKHAANQLGVDLQANYQHIRGPKVVQEAALALNQMQDRIQELLRHRTQLLASISHDLKTPITRLKLRAQSIELPDLRQSIEADLDEMTDMVDETLSFARNSKEHRERLPVDLRSILLTLEDEFIDMGFPIALHIPQGKLIVNGCALSLKRALTNVLQNARRYAGQCQVKVTKQVDHRVVIECQDDGPGIDPALRSAVFEPYYRVESSRSKDTGGVGLGLAITREIIQSHQGSITLHEAPLGGLLSKITLPLL